MRYGGSRGILPQDSGGEVGEEAVDEGSSRVNEQASFAVNKLRELNEKLEYKRQALNSIQNAIFYKKNIRLTAQIDIKILYYGCFSLLFWVCTCLSASMPSVA